MNNNNYFTRVGGIKKFQETSGMIEDVSKLNIRQVIKLKHRAKNSLKNYMELFSNYQKRLAFTKYMKATIDLCTQIQNKRRGEAIDYYYSLPKEERTPKNWNKYVSEFSDNNSKKTWH